MRDLETPLPFTLYPFLVRARASARCTPGLLDRGLELVVGGGVDFPERPHHGADLPGGVDLDGKHLLGTVGAVVGVADLQGQARGGGGNVSGL